MFDFVSFAGAVNSGYLYLQGVASCMVVMSKSTILLLTCFLLALDDFMLGS